MFICTVLGSASQLLVLPSDRGNGKLVWVLKTTLKILGNAAAVLICVKFWFG